ncbi:MULTISPECIES: phthiocerol/phthiodiolone dimycocerosyl transferase family protein [unclassified Burkholderia]|uniref:phthiocerol/phthiodiolone dimycocerosyl transferase family protein n=1 Tax=unclassified Burkholderia TaxID=2613784 RepID=UPI001E318018|nr:MULTISPECIES: condensation domain-containing protein [unclassified Burkholderia]UEP33197.1 condensation domain-containing protein [Burkholderia sp. B21-007]UEP46625.1 condensation domain-containing protein [Burkholderia sp. B21-005]
MVAEIDRRFSPDAWHAAFQALQHRHPLLSTCIAIDAQQHSGFYRVTDAAVPLRVLEQDPTAWQAEAAHEIATRFVGSAAPLLRATLLQGERSSTLILIAHHSVVDGMGSASLIDDLLCTLSGERLAPLPLVPSLETMLDTDLSHAAVLPPPAPAPAPKPFRPDAAQAPHVDAIALSADDTRRLVVRARAEQTTVHGAIAAAVHEAGRRLSSAWTERALRTVTPIDLRGLSDDARAAAGVYITQTITVDDHPRGTDIWTAARKIKQDLAPSQARASVAAELKALEAVMSTRPSVEHAAGFLSAVLAFDVMVSNLGNQPIASEYEGVSLKALWGPIVTSGFADDQIIGACTIDGVLRLTHTSHGAIRGLLEEVRAILQEAVS